MSDLTESDLNCTRECCINAHKVNSYLCGYGRQLAIAAVLLICTLVRVAVDGDGDTRHLCEGHSQVRNAGVPCSSGLGLNARTHLGVSINQQKVKEKETFLCFVFKQP
jgi:ferric-dicitrate binding protein FerR (iron transport regulator)